LGSCFERGGADGTFAGRRGVVFIGFKAEAAGGDCPAAALDVDALAGAESAPGCIAGADTAGADWTMRSISISS